MDSELASAISQLKQVVIRYAPGERIIEPHVLGYSSKGDLLLRAFQVSGASASGEPHNWKLFRVDRIEGLYINDETFDGPRPLYNPDDSVMKGGIIARL